MIWIFVAAYLRFASVPKGPGEWGANAKPLRPRILIPFSGRVGNASLPKIRMRLKRVTAIKAIGDTHCSAPFTRFESSTC